MKKKTSLKDIAKEVGVSTATVSYVFSQGKEGKVSVEMATKIKEVARKLNYQPNQIAKSLRSGRSFTIGFVMADISNPFFSTLARIIEDEATRLGYTVIFGSSDEKAEKSKDIIQFFVNRQVDGFIISPAESSEDQLIYLKENNIPFVLIDRFFEDIDSNYIVINNYESSRDVVKRLIDTKHKKIGVISYENNLYHMKERVRGYEQALQDAGIKIQDHWINKVNHNNLRNDIEQAIENLTSKNNAVDSIFFATNTIALEGIRILHSKGLKIPEDITVVNFDKCEGSDLFNCPITYVQQPVAEIGTGAVKMLHESILQPGLPCKHLQLKTSLVIKE